MVGFLTVLAGCGESWKNRGRPGCRPQPNPAAAQQDPDPDGEHRAGDRLAGRRKPVAAAGLAVAAFAAGLDHPRWLYVLPNGDVLVAETNAPPKPDDGKGIKGWVMKMVHEACGLPAYRARTASRCCATPTATASPKPARCSWKDLNSPFGMALVGRTSTSPTRSACCVSTMKKARRDHARRPSRSSTCRAARSITTGPRTSSPAGTVASCT